MSIRLAAIAFLLFTQSLHAVPLPKMQPPLIVYAAATADGVQIFSMKLDGTDVKQLTEHKSNNMFPAASPDGRSIAFSSDRDGGIQHIFVMDVDGKNVTQLTKGNETERGPAWSPDGKKIAFTRHVQNTFPNVFVMDFDGKNAGAITTGMGYSADPAWSPDGKKLAIAVRKQGAPGFRVCTMDIDGKNGRDLTTQDNPAGFVYPIWSPDGKQIAYADIANNAVELFVSDADGKNRKQVTKLANQCGYPVWLPGGKQLAFFYLHNMTGKTSIRMIDVDGSNEKLIRDNTGAPAEGGRITLKP